MYGTNFSGGAPPGALMHNQHNVQNSSLSANVNLSFIDKSDLSSYESIFVQSANMFNGLSIDVASALLKKSNLPQDVLARIWELSYVSGGQVFTFPEFCVAMHLTKMRLNGVEVPPQLPAEVRQQIIGAIATLNGIQNIAPSMARSLSVASNGNSAPPVVTMQHPMTPVQASTNPPRVWAISSEEKERYDMIFRGSDQLNSGFIAGERAREIFLQSGLPQNVLAHIWTLADTHNVGKLNGDEFAVAMHLIYRKLNGHDLPKTLPPELVPPSTRNFDSAASMMKTQLISDILNKPTGGRGYGAASSGNLHDPFLVPSPGPLLGEVETGNSLVSPQRQISSTEKAVIEARKRDLTVELGEKKQNLRALDAQAHASKSSRADLEVQVEKLKSDVKTVHTQVLEKLALQNAIAQSFRVGDTAASSNSVRFVEVQSREVEQKIRMLVDEGRSLAGKVVTLRSDLAKQQDAKRNFGTPSAVVSPSVANVGVTSFLNPTVSTDPVAAKAAAMLAQRMAALGLTGAASVTPSGSPAVAKTSGLHWELEKIEAEHRKTSKELDEIALKARLVIERLSTISNRLSTGEATPKSTWTPSGDEKLKYEDGISLRSKLIRDFLVELPSRAPDSASSVISPKIGVLRDPIETSYSATPSFSPDERSETKSLFVKSPSIFDSVQHYFPAINQLVDGGNNAGNDINSAIAMADAAIQAAKQSAAISDTITNPFSAMHSKSVGYGQEVTRQDPSQAGDEYTQAMNRLQQQEVALGLNLGGSNVGQPFLGISHESGVASGIVGGDNLQAIYGGNEKSAFMANERAATETLSKFEKVNEEEEALSARSAMEQMRLKEWEALHHQQSVKQAFASGKRAPPPVPTKRVQPLLSSPPVPENNSAPQRAVTMAPVTNFRDLKASSMSSPAPGGVFASPPPPPPPPPLAPPVVKAASASGSGGDHRSAFADALAAIRTRRYDPPESPVSARRDQISQNVESVVATPPFSGGSAPPPPPPPPTLGDGSVTPVKLLPSQESVGKDMPKHQPTPQEVGSIDRSMFMPVNAETRSGGKVSSKIKALQGNVGLVFGIPNPAPASAPVLQHNVQKATTSSMYQERQAPEAELDGWEIVTTSNSVSPVANDEPNTLAAVWEPLPTLYKVKALFTFDAARSDDLAFTEGDILWVEKDDGGNWLYGSKEGDHNAFSGYFPKNYVEVVKSKAESPVRSSNPPLEYEGYAEAMYGYEASQGDEGTITEGEVVGIIIKPEANWWKIESKAGQGLVPATYLRELDLQEGKARFDGSKNEFGGHSARSRPQIASANLELDANKSSYQRAGASLMPLESAETGARHRTPSMQGAFLGMAGSAEQWSSNVDPSLVSQISNEEKKRQEAIFELIVTEGSYVRDLQLVVEIFYRRMQDLMQEHDLRAVFANIEDILLANSVLLSSLEDLQQKNSFFIDLFGNHFATFIPSLECYATYCGNQMAAQKFLKRRQEEDAKLDRFLKETFRSGKSRSLDLNSWLLKPMQRITRYSLLLKQILQHTPNNHPDFVGLQQALRLIERVATNVNNAAQEYENRLKVAEIMNLVDFETDEVNFRIDLTTQTRHLGPRICLLEGQLTKSKSGRKLHAYLLTDILLFVEPSSKQSGSKVSSAKGYQFVLYRKPIPLVDHVAVQDTGEDSFAVVHGQDTVQVRAPNFSEKRRWISSINEQVEICMIAERSHRDQHSAMESNRARLAGVDAMGTLVINVIEARGLPPGANGKRDVYCAVELSGQILKTKALEGSNPRWNQSLSFTVVKSATTFRLATYNVDMFSPDEPLGFIEIPLDFLDFAVEGKEDPMSLKLKNSSGEVLITTIWRRAS